MKTSENVFYPRNFEAAVFKGEHPLFRFTVEEVPAAVHDKFRAFDEFVIVGMGGSILPFESLRDAAGISSKIFSLDQTEPEFVAKFLENHPKALYCVVSKSGETLEVKALLCAILEKVSQEQIFCVTDPQKGSLRKWCDENQILSLEIPSEIGGRFTNFSIFHRALLERFEVDFNQLLETAKDETQHLKKDSRYLEEMFQTLFQEQVQQWVLWYYSERLRGFCAWAQQALAESLGKFSKKGNRRVGKFPIILRGPADQHSVLQLLRDGPQNNLLWFLTQDLPSSPKFQKVPSFCKDLEGRDLADIQRILQESTIESFRERVGKTGESQDVIHWHFRSDLEDVVRGIVRIQAFIEYAAQKLDIDAFDQPGVERGKQIARELLRA